MSVLIRGCIFHFVITYMISVRYPWITEGLVCFISMVSRSSGVPHYARLPNTSDGAFEIEMQPNLPIILTMLIEKFTCVPFGFARQVNGSFICYEMSLIWQFTKRNYRHPPLSIKRHRNNDVSENLYRGGEKELQSSFSLLYLLALQALTSCSLTYCSYLDSQPYICCITLGSYIRSNPPSHPDYEVRKEGKRAPKTSFIFWDYVTT